MTSAPTIFWQVDAQADFMLPGGKLYVPGAEKIIPNLQRLVQTALDNHALIVASADAHAPDDPEFKLFPPHCVKGTPGAAIIPEGLAPKRLIIPNDPSFALPKNLSDYEQVVVEKQALDVFSNPQAAELVDMLGPDSRYIVFGVVTEYCVRCAAKGLLERGRSVFIVQDAIETLKPEEGRCVLDELQSLGAKLITTVQALAMVETAGAQRVI